MIQITNHKHWLIIVSILPFIGLGCALMHLREEFKEAESSTILVGNISSTPAVANTPVVVAAYYKRGLKVFLIFDGVAFLFQ